MTQVDFYLLPETAEDARLTFACRLAGKAVQRELVVFVLAESEADARKLDELLWTFAQNSFIPHRFAWDTQTTPVSEPVIIGCANHAGKDDTHDWDLMINLTGEVPDEFGRYERLAEVLDADPERREHGRERYRYYRDRGYELKTHQL
ncbi:MAG: DNA polymerase III subunit chi [Gammaproteobacteria bacterium]|nr:DNA polymerase III subunit chi [Gammaproteobacteria bacterium]